MDSSWFSTMPQPAGGGDHCSPAPGSPSAETDGLGRSVNRDPRRPARHPTPDLPSKDPSAILASRSVDGTRRRPAHPETPASHVARKELDLDCRLRPRQPPGRKAAQRPSSGRRRPMHPTAGPPAPNLGESGARRAPSAYMVCTGSPGSPDSLSEIPACASERAARPTLRPPGAPSVGCALPMTAPNGAFVRTASTIDTQKENAR